MFTHRAYLREYMNIYHHYHKSNVTIGFTSLFIYSLDLINTSKMFAVVVDVVLLWTYTHLLLNYNNDDDNPHLTS